MTQMELSSKLLQELTSQSPRNSARGGLNFNSIVSCSLLAVGSFAGFALARERVDKPVSADRLVAAQIGTDDVGPTVRPTLLAAIEPSPSSPENKSQHQPPEALSDASRAKVSFVAAETPEQTSIFTSITHLIGKKLPATSLEATGRPKMSGAPREVRVGKAHPDSIVCLLPGMIDSRLQTQARCGAPAGNRSLKEPPARPRCFRSPEISMGCEQTDSRSRSSREKGYLAQRT